MTRLAPLAALAIAQLASAPSANAQRGDPEAIARQVHEAHGYGDQLQFRTPEGAGGTSTFPGAGGGSSAADKRRYAGEGDASDIGDRESGARFDTRRPEISFPWDALFQGGAGLGQAMLFALLGGLLILLGLIVWKLWPRSSALPPAERPEPPPKPERAAPQLPRGEFDPDALAAAGRYREAVLALLLRALRQVGWKPAGEASLTPREVLGALPASDPRALPLRRVVDGAERARFTEAPVDQSTFEDLRGWLDQLREAAP